MTILATTSPSTIRRQDRQTFQSTQHQITFARLAALQCLQKLFVEPDAPDSDGNDTSEQLTGGVHIWRQLSEPSATRVISNIAEMVRKHLPTATDSITYQPPDHEEMILSGLIDILSAAGLFETLYSTRSICVKLLPNIIVCAIPPTPCSPPCADVRFPKLRLACLTFLARFVTSVAVACRLHDNPEFIELLSKRPFGSSVTALWVVPPTRKHFSGNAGQDEIDVTVAVSKLFMGRWWEWKTEWVISVENVLDLAREAYGKHNET
ncbi:hypothetical protein SpCBS45565_g02339 [Spizellomyces sp. 'palustris']|nr:hypothetical protein SpCBS45565_g02339 [Spizellomyces sp. 'palustris']